MASMKAPSLLALACLAISTWSLRGEDIALGQTRAEIIRILGQPEYVYSRALSRSYPLADRDIALASSGFADDVYTQHFSGIEFRTQITYKPDTSSSRLHPIDRVERVEFTPDKNGNLVQIAGLIPQTKVLCAAGCKLMGTISGNSYRAYLYPVNPSDATRADAQSVATGFRQDSSQFHFIPCLMFEFQQKPAYSDHQPPVFNTLSVDRVSLTVFDPDVERRLGPVREASW